MHCKLYRFSLCVNVIQTFISELVCCQVAVESEDITFGSVCVGETVSRTVIVHNEGALSTRFSIVPLPSENSYKQLVRVLNDKSITAAGIY